VRLHLEGTLVGQFSVNLIGDWELTGVISGRVVPCQDYSSVFAVHPRSNQSRIFNAIGGSKSCFIPDRSVSSTTEVCKRRARTDVMAVLKIGEKFCALYSSAL
jgi:hypothetical protein